MTDTPEPTLVERLRRKAARFVSGKGRRGYEEYYINPDGPEAAVEITRLTSELAKRDKALEVAWRDGFQSARDCLADDDAVCLTCDVEEDAWLDSKTRSLLTTIQEIEGHD